MTSYDDSTRGRFQNESYAKQLVSFEGMLFEGRSGVRNVTPTDIDGLVQLDKENIVMIFELKHEGGMPQGQRRALEDLCNAIAAGGKEAVVFLATHSASDGQTIIARDAEVRTIFYGGEWSPLKKPLPLYVVMRAFIKWIKWGETR